MPQDPSDFRIEEDFSRALALNPNNKFVNAPKPKGRDTRVLATNAAGLGRNYKDIQEAYTELNRLRNFDPDEHFGKKPGDFENTMSFLRKRDAWYDEVDGGYPIDAANKKARSMGFTSATDYIGAIKEGIKNYERNLPKQKEYGTTALGGSNAKSYVSQGKMSKLMEEDLKKRGNQK